jgi:Family of unknown function (DUF6159)
MNNTASIFWQAKRGLAIARATWAVLKSQPRLMILPVISAATLIGAIAVLLAGFMIEAASFRDAGELVSALQAYFTDNWIVGIAVLGLIGFVLTAISVFFNAALIFCVLRAFNGEEPSIRQGLAVALGRLPRILSWAFVAVVVGGAISIVQESLKEKLGFLGSLLGGVLDLAWAVVTYFVLPILVVENIGPISAVKRSSAILRQTWGETAVGGIGLSAVGLLLGLPAIILMGSAIWLGASTGIGAITMLVFAAGLIYLLALSAVMSTLGTIFQTGVYVYATTGKAPLDAELLKSAFQPKELRQGKSLLGWLRR